MTDHEMSIRRARYDIWTTVAASTMLTAGAALILVGLAAQQGGGYVHSSDARVTIIGLALAGALLFGPIAHLLLATVVVLLAAALANVSSAFRGYGGVWLLAVAGYITAIVLMPATGGAFMVASIAYLAIFTALFSIVTADGPPRAQSRAVAMGIAAFVLALGVTLV